MKTWIFAAGIGAVALAGTALAAAPKGNPAKGQQIFARCAACHKVGPNPARSIGPALNGVVGRAAGAEAGYRYSPAMKASGGQRTWTAMIYLNDVEEGGATWFPQAGVRVAPKRGLLLAWNNMKPDGSPNIGTLHEGTPVVKGVKYIITKWFREHAWIHTPVQTY